MKNFENINIFKSNLTVSNTKIKHRINNDSTDSEQTQKETKEFVSQRDTNE